MSFARTLSKFEPTAYSLLRVAAGFMMLFHGTAKLFGVLGDKVPVGGQLWVGGIIELVGGVLVMVGLFTRYAAFVLSGTMAVAYIQFHWGFGGGWKFLPITNHGDAAVLYAFVFLLIAARGPGGWSVDVRRV